MVAVDVDLSIDASFDAENAHPNQAVTKTQVPAKHVFVAAKRGKKTIEQTQQKKTQL